MRSDSAIMHAAVVLDQQKSSAHRVAGVTRG
jgi:hypothetical protein